MIPEPKVFENSNLNDADLLIQVQLVRAVNALLRLHGLEHVDWSDEAELIRQGHLYPMLAYHPSRGVSALTPEDHVALDAIANTVIGSTTAPDVFAHDDDDNPRVPKGGAES
jgi:hypothetical protein